MISPRSNITRTSSTKTRPVPKSPITKRAASPQTKLKSSQAADRSAQRAKSTPKSALVSSAKTRNSSNLAKKNEIEIRASEDRIRNYQKELAKVEKNSQQECERLKREIQEMQSKINSGAQIEQMQKEIASLQKQRDELKEEIAERNRNQSEIADITNEYENLENQLETLQNDKLHFEEEITRIMAINDVLLEHMKSSPKYAAYKENARLRNEKRTLTEKLQRYSEDICQQRSFRAKSSIQFVDNEIPTTQALQKALQENEAAENQRQDLLNKISQLKDQRQKELFEAFKHEANQAYLDYDASKNEVLQLEQREKQLKNELSHLMSTSSKSDISLQELQATKTQYRQAREEYINAQQDYHKNLVWELQLRIENETNKIRQEAAAKINKMKSDQEKLKEKFLNLQEAYNKSLSNDEDFVAIGNSLSPIEEVRDEIDKIQMQFGQLGFEIQKVSSEEAKKEIELADQEFREMQEISGEINKWISDLHLSSIQSQSREEALRSQIDVLNRRLKHPSLNYEHEMNNLLERAQNDAQNLNSQLADSKQRLKELDVMLGAPDNDDVSLEQRFQSIQERISALLDDTDDSPMKLDRIEQDLKDELAKLKAKSNK
ncbi:hypothetical protein TRFO_16536 [Tritrichomonas foetus]|uniref:Uncharacterized protein n=1 Tax=Tritrichomonas foetus TaxID=1144522 RepID=A0A1J4KUY0_9EUKA|nr:hypothetical protein TRFO_16536 [Tritrichomonas foetus]|eukprot:OHT13333.1 hypothetical protein TRFO_16536 [Tritrichomonas foetus]